MTKMYVIKRKGIKEPVNFNKIQKRIEWLKENPSVLHHVNATEIAQIVIQNLKDGMHTSDIDRYAAQKCANMILKHHEYGILAGRIEVNNNHKTTLNSYKDKVDLLYFRKDDQGVIHPLVSDDFYKFVKKNYRRIDEAIDYDRDNMIDFFGFKTLENGYMMHVNGKTVERPQDVFMRVAIQMHIGTDKDNDIVLERIFSTYDHISSGLYTHATPTLFNAGTPRCNLASCFLLGTEDSREGILHTADNATKISKYSGGIGIHVSNWRAKGSLIRGTNGRSGGIVKFLRIYQACALAFDQGGGKRNGSFAIYLEPHHPDFPEFLKLRLNVGYEEERCKFLFLAVWASDLFMERVQNNEEWSFFCPDLCPGLNDAYGDEYRKLYLEYESKGMAHSTMPAKELWKAIYDSQIESGIPYICYKDAVNRANMQSNIGVIKSSNLCSEIVLHSDADNYSVCILASICLNRFVEDTHSQEELAQPEAERRKLDHKFPTYPVFNYKKLLAVTAEITQNLNNVIDKTWNPCIETARTNFRNRPIGIGVQGLADVFAMFRCSFDSELARDLNKKIFETIYYAAVSQSTKICRDIYKKACEHIRTTGKPYYASTYPKELVKQFPDLKREDVRIKYDRVEDIPTTVGAYPAYLENGGSPLANGKFHWELYGLTEADLAKNSKTGKNMYDWETLRDHIKTFGMRNSHLVALMPTASTSQIMGCSSCFEPYNSNIFSRTTLSGKFVVVNRYLMNDLQRHGLWTDDMKQYLLVNNGSIQNIKGLPENIKKIYKTAFELSQKAIIDLAADRQPFVDQSQSMNLFKDKMKFGEFTSMQFYGWKRGLKTGVYYSRSRPAADAQKFTINPDIEQRYRDGLDIDEKELQRIELTEKALQNGILNTIQIFEEDEGCLMCGS